MNHYVELLMYLCAGHFFFDYAGQGDWMSQAKNPTKWLTKKGLKSFDDPAFDAKDWIGAEPIWTGALSGHALIHAAWVYYVTGAAWAAILELVVHWLTDYHKCKGYFGYNTDQLIHLWTKIAIVGVIFLTSGWPS